MKGLAVAPPGIMFIIGVSTCKGWDVRGFGGCEGVWGMCTSSTPHVSVDTHGKSNHGHVQPLHTVNIQPLHTVTTPHTSTTHL